MNTVIVIGRKELFSFAERYSARRLSDYRSLEDGDVLCCLFNLVFPELRIRPAAAQTHSPTQRARLNWEQLFRRFARLHIPLVFLQPTALADNNVECGFSTLVLFYFLHHLSKRADFSAEFALDVSDEVTAFLQSTDCIASLLAGDALSWSAIPDNVLHTLHAHPVFHVSAHEAEAQEAAAADFYKQHFGRKSRSGASSRTNSADSAESLRKKGVNASTTATPTASVNGGVKKRKAVSGNRAAALHTVATPDIPSDAAATSSADSIRGRVGTNVQRSSSLEEKEELVSMCNAEAQRTSVAAAAVERNALQHSHSFHGSNNNNRTAALESSDDAADRSPLPRAPVHSARTQSQQQERDQRKGSTASTRSTSSASATEEDFDSSIDLSRNEGPGRGVKNSLRRSAERQFTVQHHRDGYSNSSSCSSVAAESAPRDTSVRAASVSSGNSTANSHQMQQQQQQQEQRHDVSSSTSAAAMRRRQVPSVRPLYRAASSVEPSSAISQQAHFNLSASDDRQQHQHEEINVTPTSGINREREAALESALQSKEEECEALQMRVAQLLSLLSNTRAVAEPTRVNTLSASSSLTATSGNANAILESSHLGSTRPQATFSRTEQELEARKDETTSPLPSTSISSAFLEAEIAALTSDIIDDESGNVVCVEDTANLLHCLLLEYLQDSPHNRDQMQQWLWQIVAAHHTMQGRLLAAVELIRRVAEQRSNKPESPSPDPQRAAFGATRSATQSTTPAQNSASPMRSQSTVAAAFPAADADSPSNWKSKINGTEQDVAKLRSEFCAVVEALHEREHDLVRSLRAAQADNVATVQRAVHREQLWKQLCAEVYAAEQTSFAIADCVSVEEVEQLLMSRDAHYQTVEQLTAQLVQDSEKEREKGEEDEVVRSGGRDHNEEAECAKTGSCVSLQVLVSQLKAERTELQADVSRLYALLTAMQPQAQASADTNTSSPATASKAATTSTDYQKPPITDVYPPKQRQSDERRESATHLQAPPIFRSLFYPPYDHTTEELDLSNAATRGGAVSKDDELFGASAATQLRGLTALLRQNTAVH